jgi:hypothetical protein
MRTYYLDCDNEIEEGVFCGNEVEVTLEQGDPTQRTSALRFYGEEKCDACGYLLIVEQSA